MNQPNIHIQIEKGPRLNIEDAAAVICLTLPVIGTVKIMVVADGVGGGQAGEIASGIGISTIMGFIASWYGSYQPGICPSPPSPDEVIDTATSAFTAANEAIVQQAKAKKALAGMSTTAVMVVLLDTMGFAAWAGDSRALRYSEGQLVRLTKDHSKVQELLDTGTLNKEAAKFHPAAHQITQWLGMTEGFAPEIRAFPIRQDDLLILCSDGLTDALTDRDIQGLIQDSIAAQESVRSLSMRLIEAAINADTTDNATVAVYQHEPQAAKRNEFSQTMTGNYPKVVARLLGKEIHP